jgi:RHS repeat-associated protein
MTSFYSPYYPPFGSSLPNRTWSDANRGYRFGFNGKEKDSETASDNFNFGARIYDGRLGRWLSLDPLMKKYIDQSPYVFSINSVLLFADFDGKDVIITILPSTTGPKATCFNEIATTGIVDNRVRFVLNSTTKIYDLVASLQVSYCANMAQLEKINPGVTIFAKVHEGVHLSRFRNAMFEDDYVIQSDFLLVEFGIKRPYKGRADQVLNDYVHNINNIVNHKIDIYNEKLNSLYEQKIIDASNSGNCEEVDFLINERENLKSQYSSSLKCKMEEDIQKNILNMENQVGTRAMELNEHDDMDDFDGVNSETSELLNLLDEKNALGIQAGDIKVYDIKISEGKLTKGKKLENCKF